MSCSEVVYQAYYPYLYQRPSTSAASAAAQSRAAAAAHFPAFPHNYDRFNVAAYGGSSSGSLVGGAGAGGGGGGGHSTGSVSSGGGAGSPGSPPLHHKDEESTPPETTGDEEAPSPGDAVSSRAQYVSANCVVFTHYTGDVASVVDEHFTRALSYKTPSSPNSAKESSPMTSRNFPPSFWNSNYQSSNQVDLYGDSVYHQVPSATTDHPWHHPHYQYSHHRAVHEYHHHHHHHNMAAQYGSLLLGHPPPSRLGHHGATGPYHHHAATKPPEWPPHPQRPQQSHLDPSAPAPTAPYPPAAYTSMSGLEAQVQADSKDLYWF
uniref:Vestigial n=1 Tax=Sogatella furcifera TaxID=113103 RepID=A0A7U1BBQ6_SOGFU|nr:vestigial [Sogatella furcifera]